MIVPVILCGGSGTRLWPLSRELYPKQFLALTGEHTLLQQTVLRLAGVEEITPPLVICNEEHRFLVAEQLRQVNIEPLAIILEPEGRNTAPAAALAAIHIANTNEAAKMLVLPSDHLIQDVDAFQEACRTAAKLADSGRLVTFGIVPERPETGYGYIKRGETLEDSKGQFTSTYSIERFVEKPDKKTAEEYIEEGGYSWNSGMFMFTAAQFLKELETHSEDIYQCCRKAIESLTQDLDFIRLDKEAFAVCPNDSIDYAVMEKTNHGAIIPIEVGWNDIGSWSALWDIGVGDENGNVVHGDVILHDTKDSFFYSNERMIAAVGVKECVVVETDDAILIAQKDRVQDVKKIVTRLRAQGRQEVNLHKTVFRPWGSYEGIGLGDRFQVKIITVKPGAILSLQMHHHRAEHWIVVKGTAQITKGDDVFILSENESTYIPFATTHRLENPGVIPLELIEIQSGSYLGEDDIVRLEDNYGRVE